MANLLTFEGLSELCGTLSVEAGFDRTPSEIAMVGFNDSIVSGSSPASKARPIPLLHAW